MTTRSWTSPRALYVWTRWPATLSPDGLTCAVETEPVHSLRRVGLALVPSCSAVHQTIDALGVFTFPAEHGCARIEWRGGYSVLTWRDASGPSAIIGEGICSACTLIDEAKRAWPSVMARAGRLQLEEHQAELIRGARELSALNQGADAPKETT